MQFLPQLIAAMMMVESGGDPAAVGDGGRALGCLQIHDGIVQDVNRRYGASYKHKDALNPLLAPYICKLYLTMYAPQDATPEICARIWNGGPRGHMTGATVKYWNKVRAKLEKNGQYRLKLARLRQRTTPWQERNGE